MVSLTTDERTPLRHAVPAGRGLRLPALAAPATIFVTIALLGPLAMMARYSLNRFDPAELMISAVTFDNYIRFIGDDFYREVLGTTLWMSAMATAISLLLAFPVAYTLTRYLSGRAKSLVVILIVVPLLIGNAVRTAAWMVVLADAGILAEILRGFGRTRALNLMYTPTAVLIGLVSVLLPFMIITIQSVLESIDRTIEDAAQSLGASHWHVLLHIVFPLALPGILAGTMLCFILSMNAYATPVLLGGPQFHMMAPTVYQQVSKALNWPFGAAISFILMATTLVLTVGANILAQRRYRRWAE